MCFKGHPEAALFVYFNVTMAIDSLNHTLHLSIVKSLGGLKNLTK